MAKSGSSKRWLRRHVTDPYVRQAQAQGYRSRAAFKLLEIDARDQLLKPGAKVVDLGAAPGGWSQVAASKVKPGGCVVAVDVVEIAPISGVLALRGDFLEAPVRQGVREQLGGSSADVVLCDLSPNLSGIASVDQARAARLVKQAIEFCGQTLNPEGAFLVKMFQGEAFDEVLDAMRRRFRSVAVRKPGASRGESREAYVLGRGLKTS
ncbi:MAG TPA: RlmE family RNA methyltransferase [Burkholderiales bacterium]|nr:RlmE family RNA methyltransferase [Burkholderiales bacterium]